MANHCQGDHAATVKFDNHRLFIGYVKNLVRFRIRLFKFHVLEQVKKQELL